MLLSLNACLLTDVEFEASRVVWATLPYPFPSWIDEAKRDVE